METIENPNMGAGVLFPTRDGKYLLQENEKEPGMPKDKVGTLRSAGGGKSKRDGDLYATIVRELREEFGLSEEFVKPRLRLLGYIPSGDYKDCAMFELKDHGLAPKRYSAANSKYETVKLVEASLGDKRYIGLKPEELRDPKKGEYGFKDDGLSKKAASGGGHLYKLLRNVGRSAMAYRMAHTGANAAILRQINRRGNPAEFGKFIGTQDLKLTELGYPKDATDFVVNIRTGMPVRPSLLQEALRASTPVVKSTTNNVADKGPKQLNLFL